MTKTSLTIATLLAALLAPQAHAAPLIKDAEAKLPAAAEMRTRGLTRGPSIKLVSPEPAKAISSPFKLKVAFEPHGGAKIVPESVKVTYLKTPSVDLLDRVKPGLSDKGIELADAETPAGEHLIQVSLEDSEGRRSTTVLKLNVVK